MNQVEWPRRVASLAQFSVRDLENPVLEARDEHHLRTVLRAETDEEIVVTDDNGSWAFCEVGERDVRRVGPVRLDARPAPTTIYLAPLKGDRSEWAVAKATELGVSRIVPLLSEHVVVKFKGDAREKIVNRWRRIARESGAQCRRTYGVTIDDPVRVGDVPADVAVADFGGEPDWRGVRAVAIGPEGGWSPGEWALERRRLSLGPTVLRAETAGVVAASLLAFGAGEWGFTLGPAANG
ncbi:MAG: RsmE family RNA methyltransferase [Acidimicrobiales bacterium]